MRGGVKHGPYERVEWGMHSGDRRPTSGSYRNGKQHGAWSHSDEFGNGYRGHFRDGERHGLWTEHGKRIGDDDALAIERSAWIRGTRHNFAQTHIPDGTLVEESFYANGVAHGRHRTWNPSPYYLQREEQWDRGTKVGRWVEYDGPQRVSKLTSYDAGTVHGEVVSFVAGDKRRVEHYDHGVRHGVFEIWYRGRLLARTTLDHDTGDWAEYDGDKLLAKGPIAKGKRVGIWLAINDDKEWLEATFVDGVREGPATLWAEAERKTKFAEGPYAKDQQHGRWIHWMHIHGKPMKSMEGGYVRGERHGKWTFWHDNGALLATGSYRAGAADGAWVIYDDSGAVAQRLQIANGTLKSVDGWSPTPVAVEAFEREDAFRWSPRLLKP